MQGVRVSVLVYRLFSDACGQFVILDMWPEHGMVQFPCAA